MKNIIILILLAVNTLAMADGFSGGGAVGPILVKSNFVQASQVIFSTGTDTNILVAHGQFTNYAARFYWNPNWQANPVVGGNTGAYTNGSAALSVSCSGDRVFVGSDENGIFVSSLEAEGNTCYDQISGSFTSVTNGWPGAGIYQDAGNGFSFLVTNGVVGVTSNQFIGALNLAQIDGGSNITTNNASTITSGTLGLPFLPAGVITNNESLPTTFKNTITAPTNTAPFNHAGVTSFLVTGAQNTMDANRGHHFVHVWGQFTNTLVANVDVWLTNETFHSVSILGSPSTLMPAETNDFSLWIDASGGDTVTLTNKFTPGASLGVRIDGSTDSSW